jgi:hypothetical protein
MSSGIKRFVVSKISRLIIYKVKGLDNGEPKSLWPIGRDVCDNDIKSYAFVIQDRLLAMTMTCDPWAGCL